MALSDYLYEVIDALPGQYGGYANALTTLLGGDSKRQRANRNVQAAMALFGANPSEQEIQAFAANDMQPALPEEADATAYGPRLQQLRTVAQQNVPLVEAARLAGAGGNTPDMGDIEKAWRLQQARQFLNDPNLSLAEKVAIGTGGVDVSHFRPYQHGTYDRYTGRSILDPVGQSEIGVNQERAGDYRSSAVARTSRTQAQNAQDAAQAWAAEQYGKYHQAGAGVRNSQQADINYRLDFTKRVTQDPGVATNVAIDTINKKKLTGTPQRFKVKGPDGSTVWATGTMGVDGKPILTPSTLEVPPNDTTEQRYQFHAVLDELKKTYPNSTPQERLNAAIGDGMTKDKAIRAMQDREESLYDQETGDGAAEPTPVVTPAPPRAPSSAAMPPNRSGGKAAKRAQLLRYADDAVRGGADPAKVQQELQRMLQSLEGP